MFWVYFVSIVLDGCVVLFLDIDNLYLNGHTEFLTSFMKSVTCIQNQAILWIKHEYLISTSQLLVIKKIRIRIPTYKHECSKYVFQLLENFKYRIFNNETYCFDGIYNLDRNQQNKVYIFIQFPPSDTQYIQTLLGQILQQLSYTNKHGLERRQIDFRMIQQQQWQTRRKLVETFKGYNKHDLPLFIQFCYKYLTEIPKIKLGSINIFLQLKLNNFNRV
ncbi:unnamed protein product [Paramecium pentaurelia]|uniref:Uncharacterized protein n=1 Tax=Paramecium pentaurelia TaxID=43138 RepID=A0A8S1U1E8_9CILI|nr:unnamed protein product [Paramecium pentaurelia]